MDVDASSSSFKILVIDQQSDADEWTGAAAPANAF